MGRMQPQDILMEELVIGGIIIDSAAFNRVTHLITSESFYLEKHQILFNAFNELNLNRYPIDLATVHAQLKETGKLETIGGIAYIFELTNKVASTANIEYHAYVIADLHMKRKIAEASVNLLNGTYDGNLLEMAKEASKLIDRYVSKGKEKEKDICEVYDDLITDIGTKQIVGLSTGFKEVDDATNGILPPELTTIAAGPGEGKSVFALNVSKKVALDKIVLFFTLEMNKRQLVERLISDFTGYSVTELRKGEYYDYKSQRLEKIDKEYVRIKSIEIKNLNLKIIDKNIHSMNHIISRIKIENESLNEGEEIGLVVIDYLQLVPTGEGKNKTRDQLIGENSRALKQTCLELNIPIWQLSQVSRDKARQRYRLEDLRESGSIEQDSDNVWFIYRPYKHNRDEFAYNGDKLYTEKEDAFLQVEKQRSGTLGDIRLTFDGRGSKFKNYVDNSQPFTMEKEDINTPF